LSRAAMRRSARPLGHLSGNSTSLASLNGHCCAAQRSGLLCAARLAPSGPPSADAPAWSRTAARRSARTLGTGLPYTHFPGMLVTRSLRALAPAGPPPYCG